MEDAFKDVTGMFQAGAMVILKYFLLYIVLPEIVAVVVFAGILKFRGKLFQATMVGITLLFFYLFVQFGLPGISEEVTNISKSM